jgi:hypothetical protein
VNKLAIHANHYTTLILIADASLPKSVVEFGNGIIWCNCNFVSIFMLHFPNSFIN